MTADEKLMCGIRKKVVLVGIQFDSHNSKELLDWALVKVADPGDTVVAIHVSHNLLGSKQRALLDGYLEDYQGLCKEKQVTLNIEIFKGYSMRKVMVREANNQSASAVIVGITKHSALRVWGSIAKYCAKKLPPTTEVMSIHNGKVVFSRCATHHLLGPGQDPKPSFYFNSNLTFKDNQSEFGESEMSDMSGFSFDGRDGTVICLNGQDVTSPPFQRHLKRGSLSSISLPVEDFTKQRPGWPLLQTSSSVTQPAIQARNLSVVQWVMTLPHRPLSNVSDSNSPTNTADSMEKENGILQEIKTLAMERRLPKKLELIFTKYSAECKFFSHDVLKVSTSEFSTGNIIGKGGSNSVYKGILPEGRPIAVKILESSKEAWKEFIQEVGIMTALKHKRITPLLGICVEENDLISVYDCLSRGNLEENLHGNGEKNVLLPWEARYRIAVGIAEALNYLHRECARPVIHRDIKSSNILLTDELEPQLSDFGLAIWGPMTASFLMDSDVVGTFGYLAPEYFMYGKVSDKMDVYAFGVVLLELLSGRKPIIGLLETTDAAAKGGGQESLIVWAKPKLESGDLKSMLDPKLEGNVDASQMQKMALAASLCLTQAARVRPDMSRILNVLNGEECGDSIKQKCGNNNEDCSENEEENDDEVYPESCTESHLRLAFPDVNYEYSSTSRSSSLYHQSSSPLSVVEYLRKRCSRASSLE